MVILTWIVLKTNFIWFLLIHPVSIQSRLHIKCIFFLYIFFVLRPFYTERFVWLLFGFKISSYKSEEIELILSFKNRIIQILMQKVVTILQCILQISRIILKPNKSQRNRIIQIVPCKGAFMLHFSLLMFHFLLSEAVVRLKVTLTWLSVN